MADQPSPTPSLHKAGTSPYEPRPIGVVTVRIFDWAPQQSEVSITWPEVARPANPNHTEKRKEFEQVVWRELQRGFALFVNR